jgi:hypothetical protein
MARRKRKLTRSQTIRVKRQAKRLKKAKGFRGNPFAIATSQVKKGHRAGFAKKAGKRRRR